MDRTEAHFRVVSLNGVTKSKLVQSTEKTSAILFSHCIHACCFPGENSFEWLKLQVVGNLKNRKRCDGSLNDEVGFFAFVLGRRDRVCLM